MGASVNAQDAVSPQAAAAPLILSLDVGSSSIRAMVFDGRGRAVAGLHDQTPLSLSARPDGASFADPEAIVRSVAARIDAATERARAIGVRIEAVAACVFAASLVGLDASGKAITPLSTYADASSKAEAGELKSLFDEEAARQRTGCRFHPSYLPSRLLRLSRTAPEVFAGAAQWIGVGEYLERAFFGRAAATYSVASWTGLLDANRLAWDAELLDFLGLAPDRFPPLTDVNVPRRGLTPAFAARWPDLADIPWFPAVGDGAAANVGCGCVSPDKAALTMGTSSAVRAVVPGFTDPIAPGLWRYLVDAGRPLLGAALSEGGCVRAWMRQTLNLGDAQEIERELSQRIPDGHGLTVSPIFASERAPGWSGRTGASIHGLTLATTPLDILQASMEAVACRIALAFAELRAFLPESTHIVAGGGAVHSSAAWTQMLASALGLDVFVPDATEVSARGAAILALESLGAIGDAAELAPGTGRIFSPNPDAFKAFQAAQHRQQYLYACYADAP